MLASSFFLGDDKWQKSVSTESTASRGTFPIKTLENENAIFMFMIFLNDEDLSLQVLDHLTGHIFILNAVHRSDIFLFHLCIGRSLFHRHPNEFIVVSQF